MPNRLSRFWQELKRRKVIHVIVVYASAALVIIELINNITEPLRLPEWTPTFVIVLVSIGFPLAVIFSWIYDISSRGITKTEPLQTPVTTTESKTEEAATGDRFSPIANSIAVLPFQDMSPGKDQEYFCDGIAEEIINALAHVSSLKVIARTSAFAFKNQNMDMREIGQTLNVETLLEGSVRKDSNRLRITAQLIKADDGTHLWSERFDRNLDDIFAIQDEISLSIVDHLKVKVLGEEKSAILKRPTDNFELYDLLLKASHYLQQTTQEGFEKALEITGLVLQKDPFNLSGYAFLGGIYHLSTLFGNVPPNIGYPKAKESAEKALEIDNTSAETHIILCVVSMSYDWDWDAAEKQIKYAIQQIPNDVWIHHIYSWILIYTNRPDEAISEANKALELDPLSGFFSSQLGVIYLYANRFEEAIDQSKQTISMHPNLFMGHWHLGQAYQCVSKMDEATEEYRKAVELSGGAPMVTTSLAVALYKTGRIGEAEELIQGLGIRAEKEYVPATCFSFYYNIKGDHEKLYYWVERAIQEHDSWLPLFIAYPNKEFRIPNEPRFAELMKKVGLKQYFQND
jgi:adenylate cyclase